MPLLTFASLTAHAHLMNPHPRRRAAVHQPRTKIVTLFGTRPEAIKLAPLIRQLESHPRTFELCNVASNQHTTLLAPFIKSLAIKVQHRLPANRSAKLQPTLNTTCARVIKMFDKILDLEEPDLVVVQGDTTTALAGALAAFNRRCAVAHVEAGLRSGDVNSPFPEEANRQLISRLATYHFAATSRNENQLIREGVNPQHIYLVGNTIIDSLQQILTHHAASPALRLLLQQTANQRRIILTTHRRESFDCVLEENLKDLRRFVRDHEDVTLIFPVHPNPAVKRAAAEILADCERVHLIEPLDYGDFITLLSQSWLIVSDSGGVQEEAPTLGKPLLILRENTERPETVECGIARLVGGNQMRLRGLLAEAYRSGSWVERIHTAAHTIENPFGRGDSGERIAHVLLEIFNHQSQMEKRAV